MSFPLLQGTLSNRLVLLVGIPASLFLAAVLAWVATHGFRETVEHTRTISLNIARMEAARLDNALNDAARIAQLHASTMESGALQNDTDLQNYLKEIVRSNPMIYGSCVAFEPHTFIPDRPFYAPYCYWKDKDHIATTDIGTVEYNPFRWAWYVRPKELQKAVWTEPYFDDGGGNTLMTTHSVPFYKPGGGRSKNDFLGVATIDLSLSQLTRDLQSVRVAETGYVFLLSREGRFLVCPDSSKIMNVSLMEIDEKLAEAVMSGQEGFLRAPEPMGKRDSWIAYIPVQDKNFVLALVYPRAESLGGAYRSLLELTIIGVVGVVALFMAIVFLSRSIAKPISKLAIATRKIADGDLDQHLNLQINISEVRDLAMAFGKMTRDLKMRMEELKYTTTLKERMAGELNAARRIQMSMLPKEWAEHTGWPHRADVSLHAVIQPAREVGGDFYDYRFLDEKHLSILIGDVSGKGVPAAIFMAMTQTLFKGYAAPGQTAAKIMALVNNALCDESQTGMFVTLLYAVLHVETGTLELCNAGHMPPYRLNAEGSITTLTGERNPALGLMRDFRYQSSRFQLDPGDRLFFYTDGVTEAFNSERSLYSTPRLENLLRKNATQSVEHLTNLIINDVRSHSGNEEPSDDLTVLAVNFTGKSS